VDPGDSATLGFRIVAALVRQVRGTMEVVRGEGTRFRLVFPAL
jgi:two-component sensor histidine kinase